MSLVRSFLIPKQSRNEMTCLKALACPCKPNPKYISGGLPKVSRRSSPNLDSVPSPHRHVQASAGGTTSLLVETQLQFLCRFIILIIINQVGLCFHPTLNQKLLQLDRAEDLPACSIHFVKLTSKSSTRHPSHEFSLPLEGRPANPPSTHVYIYIYI